MRQFLSKWWLRPVSGLLVLACLEGTRALAGVPFRTAGMLARWLFVQGILEGALWIGPVRSHNRRWAFSRQFVALFGLFVVSLVIYVLTLHVVAAWVVATAFYILVLAASGAWQKRPWVVRLAGWALSTVLGAGFPVVIGQIESRFSDEEFFVALQAAGLGIFTWLAIGACFWVADHSKRGPASQMQAQGDIHVPEWAVVASVLIVLALGGSSTAWAYQRSFYSTQVPTYSGVSHRLPFVCGWCEPDTMTPDGTETFQRLLSRVAANPQRTAAEYGMLALATRDRQWAEAFRQAILEDIQRAAFTGPANSVKFGQYLAARRIFYLLPVMEAWPDLFSSQDMEIVTTWLTDVNRRALTVEWVDWMYALAFAYWPEGPYENQENGAGLLALLEANHLTSDALSERNASYLAGRRRGWFERFRNTDDAYIYQPEWIDNALFQAEYWSANRHLAPEVARNRALAFEWLLLQALPDGAPLGYNHPARVPLAQTAYLGAILLGDPRYVWWSARMLDWAERTGTPLSAQPGVEQAISLRGVSPTAGSCLMFGESGLPTQKGPLAPDKIVFRDGWAPESSYLLLNLRFAGWHRYKATNTVSLIYRGGPAAVERDSGESFSWLPAGRSLFRDKRIPRENLNGLLISKTGMSAVLYELTGLGGQWAQDPPHDARVERFETTGPLDVSRTVVDGWRGWQHVRTIYFFHDGPIVIVDEAENRSKSGAAAISWHLVGEGHREGNDLWLREGSEAVRVAWSSSAWPSIALQDELANLADPPGWQAIYRSPYRGQLDLATAWFMGEWADCQEQMMALQDPDSGVVLGHHMDLSGTAGALELLHNATPGWLAVDGLATDGEAAIVWKTPEGTTRVCAIGSGTVQVALAGRPIQVTTLEDEVLPGGVWSWEGEKLVIHGMEDSWCIKIQENDRFGSATLGHTVPTIPATRS